jgi:rubrerythrin
LNYCITDNHIVNQPDIITQETFAIKKFLEYTHQINPKEKQMSTTSLLDAIRVVKENERIASQSYSDAAETIRHQMGKQLFTQLSEFEKYHLQQLTALEKSMQEKGDFINYEGKVFPLPPKFEIKAAEEPNKKSVMMIISEAMDLEKQAEKAYADLAAQLTDHPEGHRMFTRLSEEEHNHYRILTEAFWSLNDFGVWKWSKV